MRRVSPCSRNRSAPDGDDFMRQFPLRVSPNSLSANIYFSGTGLISKRPEDIRANTHSAPLAHFAECAVLAGISE
jgi:hypothetical protein